MARLLAFALSAGLVAAALSMAPVPSPAGVAPPIPDPIEIWEAFARGWVTIEQVTVAGSDIGYRVTNYGPRTVTINEWVHLLSPNPVETLYDPLETTQDGALTAGETVAPGAALTYFYGGMVGASWDPEWWCTEDSQLVEAGRFITLGGEIFPFALVNQVQSSKSAGVPDGSIQDDIWSHERNYPTVVVGKVPLLAQVDEATSATVDITIHATNIGFQPLIGATVLDRLPPGYSYVPGSIFPAPDSITPQADGSTVIAWVVSLGAASADHDLDGTEREEGYEPDGFNDDGDGLIDEDTFDHPVDYQTATLQYTLVTPPLATGRYFLPRARVDQNGDDIVEAHSAKPLLEVQDVNSPPTANAGPAYAAPEGTAIAFDGSGTTDPDGDAVEYRWDFEDDGVYDTPWSTSPTALHPYGDDFVGLVRLQVRDGVFTVEDTAPVTVWNVAPSIASATTSPLPAPEGSTVSVVVTFTDPGWLDSHTATIDWGEGTNEAPPVTEENAAPDASGSFGGSHPYGDNGVFPATATVTDDDGGIGSAPLPLAVDNVAPTITAGPEAFIDAVLRCRVAGSKWSNVHCRVGIDYDAATDLFAALLASGEIERWPGSPDDNPSGGTATAPFVISLTDLSALTAVVTYDPYPDSGDAVEGDQPNNGNDPHDNAGDPVWVIVETPDGQPILTFHHTFNTQQSEIRDSEHWNHVDPWIVDFGIPLAAGVPIRFRASAADVGSDDMRFTWTLGDGTTATRIYYNNGVSPDPYPSPQVNPIAVTDEVTHAFSAGTYSITLLVEDDDGGSTAASPIILTLG